MTGTRLGRRSGAFAAAALGFALLLAVPSPASAHNFLVSSTPEEGGTLTELPEEFSVTTNESLLDVSGEAAGFALQVRDGDGRYYGDGCLTVDGPTLSTAAALGEPGEYTIGWRVVSADGHTIDGRFPFTWAPSGDFTPAPGSDAAPTCGDPTAGATAPGETDPQADASGGAVTDLLWVLGTVVVVGAVLFGTLMLLTRRRGGPKG